MPLESCMLVLDNSEYMRSVIAVIHIHDHTAYARNGDYVPTRFQAQSQAVSTVFTAKTDANPESGVGLMTMAGKAPSLLVTPTNDIGKLLSALGKANIGGTSDLQTAVQIAQLALKHRENKNQRQRIVVFVGSPLEDTQESLVKLGKRLRKNNVLVDIVTFGEEGMENDTKLNALIEAAGGGDSHLVSVPPGPHLLSDVIVSSPILYDADMPGASGGDLGEGDIDPNMDPELAMAIRMSLQEAQQASGGAGPSDSAPAATEAPPAESGTGVTLPATVTAPLANANDADVSMVPGDTTGAVEEDEEDEDEMLRRAMALSRGEDPGDVAMGEEEDEEDEEAAIARAIAMSLEEQKEDGKK